LSHVRSEVLVQRMALVLASHKPHLEKWRFKASTDVQTINVTFVINHGSDMPTTEIELPILSHFLCAVEGTTGMPPQPLDATVEQIVAAKQKDAEIDGQQQRPLPKGVVLGPDGKPYVLQASA
jgi:hypothetical protein